MSQPSNTMLTARASGRCYRCSQLAVLHAQETPSGIKGVWWCIPCDAAAYGGSSFCKLSPEQRTSLRRLQPNHAPCEVCTKTAVLELHHTAPTYLFGDNADKWPTVMVCHDCHHLWHDLTRTKHEKPL